MDSTTMLIPDARLEKITQDGDRFTLSFSLLYLIKIMEGAIDDTLWKQAADLVIEGAELDGPLPDCPCTIGGGDLTDNIYTYRDRVPLPITWRDDVLCKLKPEDGPAFSIQGSAMTLNLIEDARYIRHVAKET